MHSNIMGALHPAGSLYERPVNMRQCTLQHEAFRQALRSNGVHCLTVREILLYDTTRDVRARVELEDLAATPAHAFAFAHLLSRQAARQGVEASQLCAARRGVDGCEGGGGARARGAGCA